MSLQSAGLKRKFVFVKLIIVIKLLITVINSKEVCI